MAQGKSNITVVYAIGQLAIGGAERQLIELIKGLDRDRFNPIVVTIGASEGNVLSGELENIGIKIIPLDFAFLSRQITRPESILFTLRDLYRLRRILRREKTDIFHGYLYWAYIFGVLAAKTAGVPVIITSRRSLHTSKTDKQKKIFKFLEYLVNRFTTYIIANSRAVMANTISIEGISSERITWIYNGCSKPDETSGSEESRLAPAHWKREEDECLIGVVANLIHYKGHEHLIRAIPLIKDKTSRKFRLVFIGRKDAYYPFLRNLTETLDVQDDVVFTDALPYARNYIKLFHISVLPSLEEGFSNTVLESMAEGCPVIATAVGGNPESIIDGETGFLVPPEDPASLADRISILIENGELRHKMGQAGKVRVEKEFSVERMVNRTQDIYLDILHRKRLI